MAEGGPQLTPPDNPSGNSHLLDCPICLEQLRQPKCLPCHHSLCQECLTSYIIREVSGTSDTAVSFTCPVCRKLTHPVDKSEDKEDWAKQFPTDIAVVEMIELKNRSSEPHYCMPCQRKGNLMTSAKFWCKTTQSLFCESCKVDFHDMIHINCDVVDITETKSFLLNQSTSDKICNKHKEKMDYYCEDHKSIGCCKCITVGHRKCDAVATTEEYCEKLTSGHWLEEMRKSLQKGEKEMESLVKDFHLQLQSIADGKDTAMKNIDDLQEQIINRIEEMKKEITDDLIAKYKEERENLKVSSQKCERLKVAIQNTLESSTTAQQRNDHMDMILLYQRGQAEVESCRDLLREVQTSLSSISIEHEADLHMTSPRPALSFGKIIVRKQHQHTPADTNAFAKPLSERDVKELQKIYIKCPSDEYDCYSRGVVYLPDGRIVVGDDRNKKIKLIDTEGNVVDELKVNGSPYDMCMVDNTTVAVAMNINPGCICLVTVAPSKLILASEINIDKPCNGIAYRNGEFVVSSGRNVFIVTKDSPRAMTRQIHESSDTVFALSYDLNNGKLFTTHYASSTGSVVVGRLSSDNTYSSVLNVGVVEKALMAWTWTGKVTCMSVATVPTT
ncbi:uncharacterized protein LOC117324611 [Pecten maximus]|uniref:uncharacterized protein LOC117324611 n=1 Tax=Pecten maximus TaxID=6579 RepID=UPI0014586C8A|nr:uncharacterized protein LOC117324611 [Pecten maximus]